ncbi:MAG: NAD(P)/FAD-dependent oxidoreductase [Candidatus Edwardsbacteria bacterium]
MHNYYDVIVIGAGPAGSLAAKTIAEAGISVCLVERKKVIGAPLHCAEGISQESLPRFIEPDKRWISARINGAKLYTPDNTEVNVSWPKVGYVLNRKIFDQELAQRALLAGAEISLETQAVGLRKGDKNLEVKLDRKGEKLSVKTQLVIGADGIESVVGKWAGIKTTLNLSDLHSCAQYLLDNIEIESDKVIFFVGREIAPGGYAWVFPKGKGTANVGLGIVGTEVISKKPIEYLKEFVNTKFPKGKILEVVAGGTPASNAPHPLVADGLLLVGDAGRLTDPLSGAGIANALISGEMAGKVAIEALRKKNTSKNVLSKYEKGWRKTEGKELKFHAAVRKVFLKLKDEEMNLIGKLIVNLLKDKDPSKINPVDFCKAVIRSDPKILLLGKHLLRC